MSAGAYDFTIEQGATCVIGLLWSDANSNPINLTGYSARMELRPTIVSNTVYITLDTGVNGGIVLGGAAGTITITITDAQSTAFSWSTPPGSVALATAVYDLELQSPGGFVTRLLKGTVSLDPEVTR